MLNVDQISSKVIPLFIYFTYIEHWARCQEYLKNGREGIYSISKELTIYWRQKMNKYVLITECD